MSHDPTSPRVALRESPERFDVDQAVAVAAHGRPVRSLRFRTSARLAHAEAAVSQADPDTGTLVLQTFGLIGPGGVLPRHHTATVAAELRKRSAALHAFLDLLGGRFAAMWFLSGAKHRPTRDPTVAERALAAAVGLGTPGLVERSGLPLPAALFHAGNLAARSRSGERLRAMLEEECGATTRLREFAGGWLRLPDTEQTRLGGGSPRERGQHAVLGGGAVLGAQVWDAQSRFVVRVGPLSRSEFESLLPGTPRHRRLVGLARLSVGLDTAFALNPVLAGAEVPPLPLLGTPHPAEPPARLGWSSWLTAPTPRTTDAAEALFDAR